MGLINKRLLIASLKLVEEPSVVLCTDDTKATVHGMFPKAAVVTEMDTNVNCYPLVIQPNIEEIDDIQWQTFIVISKEDLGLKLRNMNLVFRKLVSGNNYGFIVRKEN